MLNETLKVEQKEKTEYPPLPKDIYQAELLDITAKEQPTYDTKNMPPEQQEYETVLSFQFTILEDDNRLRNVWANYIPTYVYIGKNGKNKLLRIIEALQGKELAEKVNITGDFLNKLIGKQCRISVEPKDKYSNIVDYMVAKSTLTPLTDEEKEKCTVKVKNSEDIMSALEVKDEEIDIEKVEKELGF